MCADLAEQRLLGGAHLHRALEAEEVPVGRDGGGGVAEVVEEQRPRGGEGRLQELAPLGFALEVAHLEREARRRALRVA